MAGSGTVSLICKGSLANLRRLGAATPGSASGDTAQRLFRCAKTVEGQDAGQHRRPDPQRLRGGCDCRRELGPDALQAGNESTDWRARNWTHATTKDDRT
jgi:hypothetical protein